MIPGAELSLNIPDMPEGTTFENIGTTVEVVAKGGNMSFGGVQYTLQQFHFHLPSEHLDNGTSMAMEIHMVWQGPSGQVAVVGIFTDTNSESRTNTSNTPVAKRLSHVDRRMVGRQAAEKEEKTNNRLPGIDNSFFHINAPQSSAARPSALLETVLSSVDAISKPGTEVKTKPLVMSELVNILSSGSFQT